MRLFVALTPAAEPLGELRAAVDGVRTDLPGLRWAPPEQWHLTLAFLGEVDDGLLPDLTTRLSRTAVRHSPLALWLAGAGRFGNRVLWMHVHGDTAALRRLAASVRAAARRARIEVEDRPYRPHVTLARTRGRDADLRPAVASLEHFKGRPWTAGELQLIRSHLGAGPGNTARHELVASWPLGAGTK